MKFEQYPIAPEIKKNLAKLGFKRPTDIQYKSMTPILKGEDVLAIAQTGTGKTAAFAIPIINILHNQKKRFKKEGIKCVVMAPTRELAKQITEVFEVIGRNTDVKALCIFGGVEQDPQIEKLEEDIDILVATPGRMFDLVSQGYIFFDRVQLLVLDEADHMLDLGFIKDIRDLIRFLPHKRQTLFFSATINETIKKLAYSLVRNPIRIQIAPKNPVAKNIIHSIAYVEMDDKRFFLERVINENPDSKMLIFVRTRVRAERVSKAMERVGIKTQAIHGDKDQAERLRLMEEFKTGDNKILITTDLSARGIHIDNIDYVVNYDLPDKAENYVHRVGRTGRGKEKGHAVSFCSDGEKEMLAEIEEFVGKINVIEINKSTRSETIDFSEDLSNNWQSLMKDIEKDKKKMRKKRK